MTLVTQNSSSSATPLPLLRLMQLSSAGLPVGGYSFSQGLEYAIDSGWVNDDQAVFGWLALGLQESLARVDLPLLSRLYSACKDKDEAAFVFWNATVLACRETAELSLTETAMGEALQRLMNNLDIPLMATGSQSVTFIAAFAACCVRWNIAVDEAVQGYTWAWLENQIAAATKLVPLGQTRAQALLIRLSDASHSAIKAAADIGDEQIGSSLPGQAMASSWHETQYSRLFRS